MAAIAVLTPYVIYPVNSADTTTPEKVVILIYAAAQERFPTTLLQWH